MLVFFALGNAKVLSFALGDAKVLKANGLATQWNIGFRPVGFFKCKLPGNMYSDWSWTYNFPESLVTHYRWTTVIENRCFATDTVNYK